MSITNRKERTDKTPCLNNTSESPVCQAKKTLDKETISEIYNKVEVYSNCIVLKPSEQYKPNFDRKWTPRGNIKTFSKRSRFRLFATLAKIDNRLPRKPLFISLTYHYGHTKKDPKDHSPLHNFLVQLRKFDNNIQFIWRKELQKRGAPHYHLIIFPSLPEDDHPDSGYIVHINTLWHQIADPKSRKHFEYGCKVTTIHSYREACIYLSKYIAKVDNDKQILEMGRHWGTSNNLPIKLLYSIKFTEDGYCKLINQIRNWLLKNGKEKQADPEFLNIFHEETVFIDLNQFKEILEFNPG